MATVAGPNSDAARAISVSAPDITEEGFRVIVGWAHTPFSRGIQLRLQSRRAEGPSAQTVELQRFLMTRNQALILARYLLDATDQRLPARTPDGPFSRLMRLFRRLTGG